MKELMFSCTSARTHFSSPLKGTVPDLSSGVPFSCSLLPSHHKAISDRSSKLSDLEHELWQRNSLFGVRRRLICLENPIHHSRDYIHTLLGEILMDRVGMAGWIWLWFIATIWMKYSKTEDKNNWKLAQFPHFHFPIPVVSTTQSIQHHPWEVTGVYI